MMIYDAIYDKLVSAINTLTSFVVVHKNNTCSLWECCDDLRSREIPLVEHPDGFHVWLAEGISFCFFAGIIEIRAIHNGRTNRIRIRVFVSKYS